MGLATTSLLCGALCTLARWRPTLLVLPILNGHVYFCFTIGHEEDRNSQSTPGHISDRSVGESSDETGRTFCSCNARFFFSQKASQSQDRIGTQKHGQRSSSVSSASSQGASVHSSLSSSDSWSSCSSTRSPERPRSPSSRPDVVPEGDIPPPHTLPSPPLSPTAESHASSAALHHLGNIHISDGHSPPLPSVSNNPATTLVRSSSVAALGSPQASRSPGTAAGTAQGLSSCRASMPNLAPVTLALAAAAEPDVRGDGTRAESAQLTTGVVANRPDSQPLAPLRDAAGELGSGRLGCIEEAGSSASGPTGDQSAKASPARGSRADTQRRRSHQAHQHRRRQQHQHHRQQPQQQLLPQQQQHRGEEGEKQVQQQQDRPPPPSVPLHTRSQPTHAELSSNPRPLASAAPAASAPTVISAATTALPAAAVDTASPASGPHRPTPRVLLPSSGVVMAGSPPAGSSAPALARTLEAETGAGGGSAFGPAGSGGSGSTGSAGTGTGGNVWMTVPGDPSGEPVRFWGGPLVDPGLAKRTGLSEVALAMFQQDLCYRCGQVGVRCLTSAPLFPALMHPRSFMCSSSSHLARPVLLPLAAIIASGDETGLGRSNMDNSSAVPRREVVPPRYSAPG